MCIRDRYVVGRSSGAGSYIELGSSSLTLNTRTSTLSIIVRGAASQTANLQEWQNSAGTVLASINASGNATFNTLTVNTNNTVYFGTSSGIYGTTVAIKTYTNANVGLVIQATGSGQTGDLQNWNNSAGTVIANVDSAGGLTANQLKSSGDIRIQSGSNLFESSNAGPYLNFGSSALTVNHRGVTSTTSFIVKGMASQTANLQNWNNSAGTVLTSVSSTGKLTSAVDASINGYTLGRGSGDIYSNVVFGYGAFASNTTGNQNVAIGLSALSANTTGSNNFALGNFSLNLVTTGSGNVGLGSYSLPVSTASNNVAIGVQALTSNTTADNNLAIGYRALYNPQTASENVAIGNTALEDITTGEANVGIGVSALQNTTSGIQNVAIGANSLQTNTTGTGLTAIGQNALSANTTGQANTAIGQYSLTANTTGTANTGVGIQTLQSLTTGTNNIAIGASALQNATTPTGNNAVGVSSMYNHVTGNGNVANGQTTMYSSKTGSQNTAMGSQTMRSTVLGAQQTAIGREALRDSTSIIATLGAITPGSGYTNGVYTGVTLNPNNDLWWIYPTVDITVAGGVVTVVTLVNAGIGMLVGATLTIDNTVAPAGLLTGTGFSIPVSTVTSGTNNTALGYRAGASNTTGSRNLFLGYNAGVNETGSDKLYISNSTTSTPLIKGTFDSAGGNLGSVRVYGDLQLTTKTPASAAATGTVGTITYDTDYIYICTATDTWKRVAISTW